MMQRTDTLTLDQQDPLAPLRDQFALPDGVIYLDGNSLGARPKAALARAQQVVEQEWGHDLIRSWNQAGWFDLPSRLGDLLAPLIGVISGILITGDPFGWRLCVGGGLALLGVGIIALRPNRALPEAALAREKSL